MGPSPGRGAVTQPALVSSLQPRDDSGPSLGSTWRSLTDGGGEQVSVHMHREGTRWRQARSWASTARASLFLSFPKSRCPQWGMLAVAISDLLSPSGSSQSLISCSTHLLIAAAVLGVLALWSQAAGLHLGCREQCLLGLRCQGPLSYVGSSP